MDATPGPAASAGAPPVSAPRAFLSDARLAVALVNWARYPVLNRLFGVSREQANLVTFVLALSAANATYDAVRRIIRHPWPLSGYDTGVAALAVREAGLAIAGPKAREVPRFGTLIAFAGISGLLLPGMRRAFQTIHVAEQRVGQQRRRIYGAAQRERVKSAEQRRTPASYRATDRSTVGRYGILDPVALRAGERADGVIGITAEDRGARAAAPWERDGRWF